MASTVRMLMMHEAMELFQMAGPGLAAVGGLWYVLRDVKVRVKTLETKMNEHTDRLARVETGVEFLVKCEIKRR